jgi:general secretion pathway protein B
MSYILDALRKAAEQRGATAAVLLRPSAPFRRSVAAGRGPWIAIGVVLVLLNAAVLVLLLRPSGVAVPAAPAAATRPASAARPVTAIRAIEGAAPPARQVIEDEPARPAARAPQRPAPPPASEARSAVTEPMPRLETPPILPAPPVVAQPAQPDTSKLKLEVLSYSDVAAQRLVFINGRRYREGDTVEGGARIEEIREDGVVLSDQGQRFTLR